MQQCKSNQRLGTKGVLQSCAAIAVCLEVMPECLELVCLLRTPFLLAKTSAEKELTAARAPLPFGLLPQDAMPHKPFPMRDCYCNHLQGFRCYCCGSTALHPILCLPFYFFNSACRMPTARSCTHVSTWTRAAPPLW